MNTLESTAYEIRTMIGKLNLTDDITDSLLFDKIIHYLEIMKKVVYEKTKTVDPIWVMNLGRVTCENANSGDDANVPNGSVVFSKHVLPRIMQIGKFPYLKVFSGLRTVEFTRIESFDLFYQIYRGDKELLERNPVYILQGSTVYAYPQKLGLSIQFIPCDPRDCNIKKALTPPYGDVTPYTADELRKFTIWDELPASGDLIQAVIDQIVNKDFGGKREDEVDKTQNATSES